MRDPRDPQKSCSRRGGGSVFEISRFSIQISKKESKRSPKGGENGGSPTRRYQWVFSAPGGSVLGASRGGSWSSLGVQEGPGGLRKPIWHPNVCQNGAPRPHFWNLFDTVELYFGHLRPSLFQASCLCWCSAFAFGCSPSVSFRPVLSARWPVLGRMPL